jgi:hypothetical protein
MIWFFLPVLYYLNVMLAVLEQRVLRVSHTLKLKVPDLAPTLTVVALPSFTVVRRRTPLRISFTVEPWAPDQVSLV